MILLFRTFKKTFSTCVIISYDLLSEPKESLPNTLPCLLKTESNAETQMKDYIILIVRKIFGMLTLQTSIRDGYETLLLMSKQLYANCHHLSTVLIHLCGQIKVSQMISVTKHQWKTQPLTGYAIDIMFHKLNIFYSQQCEVAGLSLMKITDCHHEEVYCGHLPSWNESCPCQSIFVTLATYSPMGKAEFDLSYQISKKKHLTVFINVHLIRNHKPISSSSLDHLSRQIQQMTMFIYAEHGAVIQLTGKPLITGI